MSTTTDNSGTTTGGENGGSIYTDSLKTELEQCTEQATKIEWGDDFVIAFPLLGASDVDGTPTSFKCVLSCGSNRPMKISCDGKNVTANFGMASYSDGQLACYVDAYKMGRGIITASVDADFADTEYPDKLRHDHAEFSLGIGIGMRSRDTRATVLTNNKHVYKVEF